MKRNYGPREWNSRPVKLAHGGLDFLAFAVTIVAYTTGSAALMWLLASCTGGL